MFRLENGQRRGLTSSGDLQVGCQCQRRVASSVDVSLPGLHQKDASTTPVWYGFTSLQMVLARCEETASLTIAGRRQSWNGDLKSGSSSNGYTQSWWMSQKFRCRHLSMWRKCILRKLLLYPCASASRSPYQRGVFLRSMRTNRQCKRVKGFEALRPEWDVFKALSSKLGDLGGARGDG